jgi:hypothetical protein
MAYNHKPAGNAVSPGRISHHAACTAVLTVVAASQVQQQGCNGKPASAAAMQLPNHSITQPLTSRNPAVLARLRAATGSMCRQLTRKPLAVLHAVLSWMTLNRYGGQLQKVCLQYKPAAAPAWQAAMQCREVASRMQGFRHAVSAACMQLLRRSWLSYMVLRQQQIPLAA